MDQLEPRSHLPLGDALLIRLHSIVVAIVARLVPLPVSLLHPRVQAVDLTGTQVALLQPRLEALFLAVELISLAAREDLLRAHVLEEVVAGVGKGAEVWVGSRAETKDSVPGGGEGRVEGGRGWGEGGGG